MGSNSWSEEQLRVLEAIHPSLEQVMGETRSPPSAEEVEAFVDQTSNYGFHATSYKLIEKILKEGIKTDWSLGNIYFIADRTVSEGDVKLVYLRDDILPSKQISTQEYLDRLGNSIQRALIGAKENNESDGAYVVAVIDRNLAVPQERKVAIESGDEQREYRGEGYHGDPYSDRLDFGPFLDEGAVTKKGQVIPANAIIGVFGAQPETFPTWLKKNDPLESIKMFYELVSGHFAETYAGKKANLPSQTT